MKYLVLAFSVLLVACASSGVVSMGSEKYLITKNTAKFGGGISTSAAAEVNEEAQAFCVEKGKKMDTIDLQLSPGRIGSMGSVSLQFRCL